MRAARPGVSGDRLRSPVVVLLRSGLRIGEAFALVESGLDPTCGQGATRQEARANVLDALDLLLTPDEQRAGETSPTTASR